MIWHFDWWQLVFNATTVATSAIRLLNGICYIYYYLIEKALKDRNAGGEHGMQWEDHVVEHHRINSQRISHLVLVLQILDEIEAAVEHAVQGKAHDIEGQEIKVQSLDGLAAIVAPDLRIEGHRPGHKVNPAKDDGGVDQSSRFGHSHAYEHILHTGK